MFVHKQQELAEQDPHTGGLRQSTLAKIQHFSFHVKSPHAAEDKYHITE